jgi:predicted methyltransferase
MHAHSLRNRRHTSIYRTSGLSCKPCNVRQTSATCQGIGIVLESYHETLAGTVRNDCRQALRDRGILVGCNAQSFFGHETTKRRLLIIHACSM